jgi:hypothetical protein
VVRIQGLTFLGFTTAHSEPVMCAIILSAQHQIKAMDISGYNTMAQLDDEEPIEWGKYKISSTMVQTRSSH